MKFYAACSLKGDKASVASYGISQPAFAPLAYSVVVKGNSRDWKSSLLCNIINEIRKQMLRYVSLELKSCPSLHSLGPA